VLGGVVDPVPVSPDVPIEPPPELMLPDPLLDEPEPL
jgi:hypothetical protein